MAVPDDGSPDSSRSWRGIAWQMLPCNLACWSKVPLSNFQCLPTCWMGYMASCGFDGRGLILLLHWPPPVGESKGARSLQPCICHALWGGVSIAILERLVVVQEKVPLQSENLITTSRFGTDWQSPGRGTSSPNGRPYQSQEIPAWLLFLCAPIFNICKR